MTCTIDHRRASGFQEETCNLIVENVGFLLQIKQVWTRIKCHFTFSRHYFSFKHVTHVTLVIGHFRVAFCICFKTSPGAHLKGCAPGLVLKGRHSEMAYFHFLHNFSQ